MTGKFHLRLRPLTNHGAKGSLVFVEFWRDRNAGVHSLDPEILEMRARVLMLLRSIAGTNHQERTYYLLHDAIIEDCVIFSGG